MRKIKVQLENMVLNDSYSFMILSDFSSWFVCEDVWEMRVERTLRKVYLFIFYFIWWQALSCSKEKFVACHFSVLIKHLFSYFLFFKMDGGWMDSQFVVCVLLISFDFVLISSYKQFVVVFFYFQTRKQTRKFSNKLFFFLLYVFCFVFFSVSQECSL